MTKHAGGPMKLTPTQVMQRAGVSPYMIYTWSHEQRLPHYRVGKNGRRGRIFIDTVDLDELFEACRNERHPPLVDSE